jgi:hypothetical protein
VRLAKCVALALVLGACSRHSSEPPSANEKPSATASVSVLAPAATSAALKTPAAPATPRVPPQHVACGDRDFYRITRSALQVFEIAAQLPPPQIRGGRIALQTNEVAISEPTNLFSSAPKNVVVVAKDGVLRYELGKKEARLLAPIPARAPLHAWTGPRHADSFYVHTAGDGKVREYSLAGPGVDAGAPPARAQIARSAEDLPGFDARFFTLLADKTPFYSTAKGLVRRGDEANPASCPDSTTLLFADSKPHRYFTGDAAGRVALWDTKQAAAPVSSASVPGTLIDAAQEGARVAVLSLVMNAQGFVPTVTIFSNGQELARVDTGPGARQQPELDLCLIAGRPWVVVGTRRWLQLIDWESRRLLAEW